MRRARTFALIELPFDRLSAVREGRRAAFTLIELLVVVAILSLLVSILVPSLREAQYMAQRVACLTRVRGSGAALQLYVSDNGEYPTAHGQPWAPDNPDNPQIPAGQTGDQWGYYGGIWPYWAGLAHGQDDWLAQDLYKCTGSTQGQWGYYNPGDRAWMFRKSDRANRALVKGTVRSEADPRKMNWFVYAGPNSYDGYFYSNPNGGNFQTRMHWECWRMHNASQSAKIARVDPGNYWSNRFGARARDSIRRALLCCPSIVQDWETAAYVFEPHARQIPNGIHWPPSEQVLDRNYVYNDGSAFSYILSRPGPCAD